MHIFFQRTGGFAGLRISGTIDTDDLDEDDAKTIYKLLDEMDFFDLPAQLKSDSLESDSFHHTITIESKKGTHSVAFTQPNSQELSELSDLLIRLLRRRARRK